MDGEGSGKLLHALADKCCSNFGTCRAGGTSSVNAQMLDEFETGLVKLLHGKCVEVVSIKRHIVELMSVPLVQGALRSAYKVDRLSGGPKERGEGAALSAAILPRIAGCDVDAAHLIHKAMRIDAETPMHAGFVAVKEAFESTYACMGITCADVGGLVLEGSTYYDGAAPCGPGVPTAAVPLAPEPTPVAAPAADAKVPAWATTIVIVIVSVLVVIVGAVGVYCWTKSRRYKHLTSGGSKQAFGGTVIGTSASQV
eukprot:gnl/TRDRNA2_/TRDRNA2_61098_c0_seq1.p1 gnl/TRDRNA2_/TRDRNA2_61098_c0~~gnl/TRDRNA2_/TRDRNA2_61098_c0_seq1.p1  ORF type:complete len:262 (-),score=41.40 gnl/TRDRNA2_/TRDRNA2_61098_c0_seq1:131-895(-)